MRKNKNKKKLSVKHDERKKVKEENKNNIITKITFFVFISRNELKITAIHQLKYATDQDFRSIGLSMLMSIQCSRLCG
jgi:hypothetical protein